ncbi:MULTISPECIES: DUF461 domain-containing protein [Streptomyces]|uniref:DUF461 domain-containing protein n=1 Tax=Streptomyces TaxID=1883 RepID=UPI00103ED73D|nr:MULTISPECIES: DUF461 domain-containing protein [Streptomyces]MBT3076599.1 DUF461 domain-containing protein [Streptomyces sp. COG21]MBT3078884.1 DUF461 domain-containing protein [Streptomyces sp. COG20]MBT3087755.1 DUF461 domain-containing protein [Streptomyces sp. CYG21]MBT3107248.1 DUF461 domain-containing protein [Streptomyces sp. COG19]MBT3111771.1 DUF461 domain-containing protein [Streptomyces sp. CYG20]
MSRSLRHGALAATAIAFSIVSLSACAAGNHAETLKVRPDNAATSVGTVKVQNVNVITQADPEAEGPAVVAATLFNDGTENEVLESITLPGTDVQVKLQAAKGSGPVEVPAGGQLVLGGKGNASAVIAEGREAAQDGNIQQVVFKLSRTGDVGLGATVVPAEGYYEDFGPSALPASPAPKPSATPDATGSATPETPETPAGETPATGESPAAGTEQGAPETATAGTTG